jgi:hypothetical protein
MPSGAWLLRRDAFTIGPGPLAVVRRPGALKTKRNSCLLSGGRKYNPVALLRVQIGAGRGRGAVVELNDKLPIGPAARFGDNAVSGDPEISPVYLLS